MLDRLKDSQRQMFVPTPEEQAMALHQEIDELSRKLHTIVSDAAVALCAADDDDDEAFVPVPRGELKRLLDLASQSPDLAGRSKLEWDKDHPAWRELGRGFHHRLLADLAARTDLGYEEFTRILGRVCGDDPDDVDGRDIEVPDAVGVALVRAWIRSGRGYSEGDQWLGRVSWQGVPPREALQVLDTAVECCLSAAIVGHDDSYGLEFWLENVAPLVHRDPVARFEWLVEAVTQRSNEGHIRGCAEFVSHILWRWFCDIPKDNVEAVVQGLRALDGLAGYLDDAFEELSTCVADAWRRFDWGALPGATLSELLGEGVAHGVTEVKNGGRADEMAHWVGRIAPLVYPDLADRLLWFADAVGKPSGDAPPFPEDVNTSLTELVCDWLTELEERPIEDIAAVVRAFRRTSMAACVHRPDIDGSLESLSETL